MVIFIIAALFAAIAYSCCVVAGEEDELIYNDEKAHSGLLEEDEP